VGTLSYSLYLWQGLFAHYSGIVHVPFPFDWLATLACATASYYWVERPFLRLKRRFAPRQQLAIAAQARAAAV
jgi:peptidoglycan/LPS O-acetylase OafA/YrhL